LRERKFIRDKKTENMRKKRILVVLLAVLLVWVGSNLVIGALLMNDYLWGIERSGFFNGREKWAKGFENQRV